jgi:HAD superfamily hydrolase (TIGR01490 family)
MAELAGRPFAAFDIDGTIIRWQLYHAIAEELAHAGVLGGIEYETVRAARLRWKNRHSHDAFEDYERTLVNVVDAALTGISVEQLKAACSTVITQYKNQVYTFTRDLIKQLQSEGYLLFAISASQSDIVRLLAEYYNFDDFGGSTYDIEAGFYTGRKVLLKTERKPEYLKKLVAKHNATWRGSIAVGDTESDIPLLSCVENPIAFNPSSLLFEHAKAERWRVVIERKNMIYDLKDSNGTYVLA